MVTRVQGSKAANGGTRSVGRGWARLSTRPLVVATIIAALLVTLLAGVVVSRAYTSDSAVVAQAGIIQQTQRLAHRQRRADSAAAEQASVIQQDPDTDAQTMASAAVSQPGAVTSLERLLFLERNWYLPVGDSADAGPGQRGSQQARLHEIEVRDNGDGAAGGAVGPCLITPELLCP